MSRLTASRIFRALVSAVIGLVAAAGDLTIGKLHAESSARVGVQSRSNIASPSLSEYQATLDRYCVRCHNARLRTGNLVLGNLTTEGILQQPKVWERVLQKLRAGAMPPQGQPRPDKTTYDGFVSSLEGALDQAAALTPNPGRSVLHRLNRTEYANVIRDLLGLEVDSSLLLPRDDTGYGFDNNADHLTVSPMLMERYMSAARKLSRLAVGDVTMGPVAHTYSISSAFVQDDRVSEDLPFGSRGGLAVRHHFPLDGEYELQLRLQRNKLGGFQVLGINEPKQPIEVRVDGTRIAVFSAGGQAPVMDRYDQIDPQYLQMDFKVRFAARAGTRVIGIAFLKRTTAPQGLTPQQLPVGSVSYDGKRGAAMSLDVVQVAGPFDPTGPGETPSRRQILVCRPTSSENEESCAKQILATVARRAYRRPVSEADLHTLLSFYRASRAENDHETGIRDALERILVDPKFLFRVERDPMSLAPATPYRLDDFELASRLSFFLWSSIPDDELLDVAASGTLKQPAVLERQVRRMLADQRADVLVTDFAAQWLYLRNIRAVTPDQNEFPRFDDNLRQAFERETELFLLSQLREDRSVVDLLTANYSFLNEQLARHYGIPKVYGGHFRRVEYQDDKRAGLLGHGSILTVTSYATRTSPVVRGKWLLENILGAPPPNPPDDVPALKENNELDKPMSVRERLEQHRANPVCASCHAQMDPLGFALENFNAIGAWRDTSEANTPIDATGIYPDGSTFQGPTELRRWLHSRREEFVATFARKLLTYALGRGVEYYDEPALRTIMREAKSSDYRWSSIVLGITKSIPFQMRLSASEESLRNE